MHVQLSAILVPPANADAATFEKFLQEEALPAADQSALTRITVGVLQSVMKGEDKEGRAYYLWRAELDLMTDQDTVASGLPDEMWAAMQQQLLAQDATLTSPLVLVLPKASS